MSISKKTKAPNKSVEKIAVNPDFLTVGIGASAGGIKALKEFFAAMPSDSGMAFVVILHLSEEHESSLAHILQTTTEMPVTQVTETVKVEPNHVYVIPPAKGLAIVEGTIQLTEPEHIRGKRVPIDLFFRTLADAYGKNGIAVVLSGTGSDGTLGLKRVKESGGIGIAQEPSEAEYDGMPRSAINTGLVDLILPVGEMPARIIGLRRTGEKIRLPKVKDEMIRPKQGKEPDALNEILAIVRVRTGHDFSNYKHATVLRRIARRLQVHGFAEMPEYLAFLRENADEAGQLQRDLLITVTNFFRDKEAFEVLEREIIPKLFAGKTLTDTVRVWSVGCATGEEAYSLAILLDEYASRITDAPNIQIFASDINEQAIAAGRDCFYEETIAADVSPERLRHYFVNEGNGYRVRKKIRETVLFAPHNILRDPPFSKLDLIVCRNLLIYFNRETQEKVLGIFNFALRRDGFLFLGASESAENLTALFSVTDKKQRIYKARPAAHFQILPAMPERGKWNVRIPQPPIQPGEELPVSYGEIHYKLVEQFAPPSVLVNNEYEIVHVSEHAGRFLRVGGGSPTHDLLKTVLPALKLDLQSALFEAKKGSIVSESSNIRFESGGSETLVNITVRRVNAPDTADGFYLVIFDESKTEAAPEEAGGRPPTIAGRDAMDSIVQQLEKELLINRERLRTTIEQNETSSEELKASNEELQAINEELRSASEELETGKEELQSLNEELMTVNAELKDKVDETIRINSDLQNLIQSTDIGTIFLDRDLKVKRFTPRVAELFNIIPSDIGRPLEHITHRLDYDNLTEDAGEALLTLHLKEHEVRGGAGDSRYLVRLAPYRTLDDKIDGVVLSFQDITDLKRAGDLLQHTEQRFRTLFELGPVAIFACDRNGVIQDYNRRAAELWGRKPKRGNINEKYCGSFKLYHPDGRLLPHTESPIVEVLRTGVTVQGVEVFIERPDGSRIPVIVNFAPLKGEQGEIVGAITSFLDITERKQTEEQLKQSEEWLRTIFEASREGILVEDNERINYINKSYVQMLGYHEPAELIGQPTSVIISPEDAGRMLEFGRNRLRGGEPPSNYEFKARRKDGTLVEVETSVSTSNVAGKTYITTMIRDITKRKRAEAALRESEERFRAMFEQANIGIVQIAFDGKFLAVNPGFCKIVGYAEKKLQKMTVRDITHPDDYELEEAENRRLTAGEISGYSLEKRYIHKNGSLVWGTMTATLVRRESGEPIYMLSIVEDITTRKQAEAALRESESRYRTLFNSIDEGFCTIEMLFDKKGKPRDYRFLELNPMFEKLTGLKNAAGKTVRELVPTFEDKWIESYGKVALTGESVRFEDNSEPMNRWFDVYASRIGDETSRKVAIVFTNITERKRMEEALLRSREELEMRVEKRTAELAEANENLIAENAERLRTEEERVKLLKQILTTQEDERRRIARDMHDHFGQQLTALRLQLESIGEMCDEEVLRSKVSETQEIAKQLDSDVSFLVWELRPTALDDLGLKDALANYVQKWTMQFGIPAEFLVRKFDAPRLSDEAATNLYRIAQEALNNIYKHARASRAEVLLEQRGDTILMIVEDDGIGFTPEEMLNRKKGFGLVGMRERAALVGGSVEIESAAGSGTTIFVRVPVR